MDRSRRSPSAPGSSASTRINLPSWPPTAGIEADLSSLDESQHGQRGERLRRRRKPPLRAPRIDSHMLLAVGFAVSARRDHSPVRREHERGTGRLLLNEHSVEILVGELAYSVGRYGGRRNGSPDYVQPQKALLALSHSSQQLIAAGSGHAMTIDRPEVIVDGIHRVVEAVRQRIVK